MEQKQIIQTIEKLKTSSQKRNFKQSIDLIITLKDIDTKKSDAQLTVFANLPHLAGKEAKICALVGPEMKEEAKAADKVVLLDEFDRYKTDKKALKKLSSEFDFFIAQANLMVQVAQVFGRVLGPKGKMPNPKAGCVVPSKTNLKPVVDRLRKSSKLMTRNTLMVQCAVGKEDMDPAKLTENIQSVYNQVLHALPQEKNNIKHVMLKLSMSKPMKVE
ncbi:MAG TPA: 50S ribosomal protein L1 [Candidatus Nanoarchaeia archaeon]|nr:50S ribosomal protein L1 [Candidatus Nanoarchaeia archaeon]